MNLNLPSSYKKKTDQYRLLKTYSIRGYVIRLYQTCDAYHYDITPKYNFQKNPYLFTELNSILSKQKKKLGKKILEFDELIDTMKSIFIWRLFDEKFNIDSEIVAELFIYKTIKLDKLMPLFLDDYVNEIYMDQDGSKLYLDHQLYGRCNTEIILEEEELGALITRIKLEHPISISYNNPSLKVEIQNTFFHLRISMDFPPISPKGPSFNIRKLKRNPLTLADLIDLGSVSQIIGVYLVEAVKNRRNITIIGEPNSGKTTLANAIDLFTPKHWRKIFIEDAVESLNQTELGYKQMIIQVDSFESNKSMRTKTAEILKLLHRSPDWIYLGEIQSAEHTRAMFEALNAGLKGIQTAHSDSLSKLFRRWKNHHKITNSDFLSLDIIVIMERILKDGSIKRRIKSVYEIKKDNQINDSNLFSQLYDFSWEEEKVLNQIEEKSTLGYIIPDLRKKLVSIKNINN